MTKNALVPVNGKVNALYRRMQIAITDCYTVDDCKNIATEAGGIAAYYAQIKDDASVRRFLQIKLRAWRRIGQILSTVDKSGCKTPDGAFNTAQYIRKIKKQLGRSVENLTEHAFRSALKLANVPDDFFEKNADGGHSVEAIISAFTRYQDAVWRESPEGKAEARRVARDLAQRERYRKYAIEERAQEEELARRELQEENAARRELENAQYDAFKEVGITLDRRHRLGMKQIVFLIKQSIYETLRQAAFDNRVTMQSILRSGLMMWFNAHGYNVQADDLNLEREFELDRQAALKITRRGADK